MHSHTHTHTHTHTHIRPCATVLTSLNNHAPFNAKIFLRYFFSISTVVMRCQCPLCWHSLLFYPSKTHPSIFLALVLPIQFTVSPAIIISFLRIQTCRQAGPDPPSLLRPGELEGGGKMAQRERENPDR